MKTIRTFVVEPSLPEKLKPLKRIAYNVWWSWDHDATELFRRLDRDLWEETGHNPVKMLGKISQERLNTTALDDAYLAHLDRICRRMDAYIEGSRWFDKVEDPNGRGRVAYFSLEFGLHECLPIYSGGLGILAGDHLKSASDLGIPLVAVGLLYRQGYFQQYLNADGWQQEQYPDNDFYNMPVTLMLRDDGRPIRFHIDLAGQEVVVQIWQVNVGRITLYLLDTNLRCNRIEDRQVTAQLYGGDNEMRIRQEIILGIGGLRALEALDIKPTVCHMNEGHAAFLSLERIRKVMEEKQVSLPEAREATVCGNVFTTHTPVPAGHDVFPPTMMEKYFGHYYKSLGLSWQDFLAFGRNDASDMQESFSMTNLALRLSTHRNGVSQLHGEVSRHLCSTVWRDVPVDEVPITSITNGVHVMSWISNEMCELFDRYLGPQWRTHPTTPDLFNRVDNIPDEELWRTHERRRERLVSYSRKRLRWQLERRGASPADIKMSEEVLDPEVLTIGFARRFATYKRGALMFRDIERFARIIADEDRPVQVIFAGKAHPHDTGGKELIRKIVHFVREDVFRRRVVFLENYDIDVARNLVQGVDVWLNTPRRGMEASGTSGMKVLGNGGLNCSILDGWWCEGFAPDTGWAIGHGESYDDGNYADEVESNAIYDLLEKDVVPLFYDRGYDRLPRSWIRMMKSSIKKLTPRFSTSRMVAEYGQGFYVTSDKRHQLFNRDEMSRAKGLAGWKESIRDRWGEVSVGKVDIVNPSELLVGGKLQVRCRVALGSIDPADVAVELYHGPLGSDGQIEMGEAVMMDWVGSAKDEAHVFSGFIPCRYSGQCGFAVRVVPSHPDLVDKHDTSLIRWDEETAQVMAAVKESDDLIL